jgi:hypothetical protein
VTGLSAELASALAEVTEGGSTRFGHRQHIHLAYLAAHRYGQDATADVMRDWITQIAAAHGVPGKYHETITVAWARLVALHVTGDPDAGDFAAFAARYPALLDKDLLARHYSAATLGSARARAGWVPPDLADWPTA